MLVIYALAATVEEEEIRLSVVYVFGVINTANMCL
jgi:hypothetical protein